MQLTFVQSTIRISIQEPHTFSSEHTLSSTPVFPPSHNQHIINKLLESRLIDIVAFLATHLLAFSEKIDAFKSEDEGAKDSFYVCLIQGWATFCRRAALTI